MRAALSRLLPTDAARSHGARRRDAEAATGCRRRQDSILTNTDRAMSAQRYLVSARKYRPKIFDDLVAQDHVAETLKNALRSDRLAHAYLFSGPPGGRSEERRVGRGSAGAGRTA